jgi:hypothetical protein
MATRQEDIITELLDALRGAMFFVPIGTLERERADKAINRVMDGEKPENILRDALAYIQVNTQETETERRAGQALKAYAEERK